MKQATKRKRKAKQFRSEIPEAISQPKQRRSIPIQEHHEILAKAVNEARGERNIWDERKFLLSQIDETKGQIEFHKELLHQNQLFLKEQEEQLADLQDQIRKSLDLNA